MKYINEVGMIVAKYLEKHPKVRTVFYTGLVSHPHNKLSIKYLKGHGGIISFEIDVSKEKTSLFVDSLKIPFMGTNFGSQHSMVEQCSIFTYYNLSNKEREELDISDSLIRFSIGYEDVNKIIEDMGQAFAAL